MTLAIIGISIGALLSAWILIRARRKKRMREVTDRLTASVSGLTSVTAGVLGFIAGLSDKLRELADDGGDVDSLNALADQIDEDRTELAAAITANTVAAGEPTPDLNVGSDTGTSSSGDASGESSQASEGEQAADEGSGNSSESSADGDQQRG